jgi:hypothetical protein
MSASENRNADATVFVRLTRGEKDEIRAACDRLIVDVPGARLGIGSFLKGAGLAVARGELVRRPRASEKR